MLNFNFFFFSIFSIFFFLFTLMWANYLLLLRGTSSKFVNYKDQLEVKKQQLAANLSFSIFFNFFKFSYLYFLLFFFILKNFNIIFFFKHISFEPFNFYVYIIVLLFFFILIYIFEKHLLNLKFLTSGIDFFTALWLFFCFTPFSIFSNTLLTFFFFLEFGSISTIYLIISAKDFFNFGSTNKKISTVYFNSIFFQFWASFFSSILLIYAIIATYFMFGSTEWSFLNFFLQMSLIYYTGVLKYQILFSSYLFIFAILIKMGISPFFFFKIEIYKGLPLIILYYYSIFYFFFFFILIALIFLYYFSSVILFLNMSVLFFITLSTIIFVINLFNLYLLKNFFAMSSLINAIMFFFLIFMYAI